MSILIDLISKFFLGFIEMWTRDLQNQQLGAAKQREANDEAVKKERDRWDEIDSVNDTTESSLERLSNFARKRRGDIDT